MSGDIDRKYNWWFEGKTHTLGTGNKDSSIDLGKGTVNQSIKRVKIAVPGGLGNIKVVFYNGTVAAGTVITGDLYIGSQPDDGFDLKGVQLTSGTLGWRISGITSGTPTGLINASYVF